MPTLFDIRDLSKVYRMGEVEVHALRNVTLTLDEGTFVCLLGPSGSGKSTLLNIVGGLDVPTSGQVVYRGEDLTHADETALTAYRRRHVGFVFQFYNLIPSLTALENVALVTEIVDSPMAPAEALGLVQLQERLHHFPSQMSGGEQQRVAIGRAFVTRPRLLFADEPTGNLDPATGAQVIDLLFSLNRENGATLLMVTHDEALTRRCDRVLRLASGRLVNGSGI
jgi:putative ABC transport system ATP-binding protein